MIVIEKVSPMQLVSTTHRKNGQRIAVVPTMGYLHKGHTSLISKAKEVADIVITTSFVNPTQFAPHEDFERYPKNFERDVELAKEAGSDYFFLPNTLEMYPIGFSTEVTVKRVTENFEAISRPDHFKGVSLIVAKLLNATLPDFAIFGQKDYQQTLVIKRLITDLNFPVEIVISSTVREFDGLAMSSRNVYLNEEDRKTASILFATLEKTRQAIEYGEKNRKIINAIMLKNLRASGNLKIDYALSALANDLDQPDDFLPGDEIVLLIAVYLGKTRLIDNTLVKIPYQLSNDDNFKDGF